MKFHHTQLPNGLEIIGETNPLARSVAAGFFVRTGARDETAAVSGVTHFLEHMIFKGTAKRDAIKVNRDFDAIGSHPNAYTSEENTVFHAATLPEYLGPAIEILADILRPSLRVEDFDMEKQVILEEIGMYYDEPSYSVYEAAKRAFFADHPLGKSVLGTPASITALTRDQMHQYFSERYVASNIIAVVAGNFEWDKLVQLVETYCGHWQGGVAPRVRANHMGTSKFESVLDEKIVQQHLYGMSSGPQADSEMRYAAEVLATVIGDDTGSRLYWALEDPGMVDAANMAFHEYDGTGAFFTYISGDTERFQEAIDTSHRVLSEVQRDGISAQELQVAKSKLGARMVRGSERPMGRMQALGYYWTYLKKYRTVDEELAAVDGVTLEDIRGVLDQFPVNRYTAVALGPLKGLRSPV